MVGPLPSGHRSPPRKRSSGAAPTTIESLEDDILCIVFSFIDLFDLARCSAVCKSWNGLIRRSKLLKSLYLKLDQRVVDCSEQSLGLYLEELAMERHRKSLVRASSIDVHEWKGHSVGVDQCRMKMGLVLTGVGDKVMRLWSLENFKCVEQYPIPSAAVLMDFDFDESKIVGLVGTQVCIWRRNGKRSVFPANQGTFPRGLCMGSYFDPAAVVGCEDGTARVFDMYSRRCSQIIRMHTEPVACLCLSEDQLIISGSSLGCITVSDLSSDQRVITLKPTGFTGIKTLCFNPCSRLVFAGTTVGYISCWDLRMRRRIWETRVSPNVVFSLQHLRNDTSTLVVGGIDGVLRVLDQSTGDILSSYVMDSNSSSCSSRGMDGIANKRAGRELTDHIDRIPRSARPPITCLGVGMRKVVTTHNGKYIRLWKFNK